MSSESRYAEGEPTMPEDRSTYFAAFEQHFSTYRELRDVPAVETANGFSLKPKDQEGARSQLILLPEID
jgi:hypothetical protein